MFYDESCTWLHYKNRHVYCAWTQLIPSVFADGEPFEDNDYSQARRLCSSSSSLLIYHDVRIMKKCLRWLWNPCDHAYYIWFYCRWHFWYIYIYGTHVEVDRLVTVKSLLVACKSWPRLEKLDHDLTCMHKNSKPRERQLVDCKIKVRAKLDSQLD